MFQFKKLPVIKCSLPPSFHSILIGYNVSSLIGCCILLLPLLLLLLVFVFDSFVDFLVGLFIFDDDDVLLLLFSMFD